jgi:hypothetical protein
VASGEARRNRPDGEDAQGRGHPHRRRRHAGHWGLNYPKTEYIEAAIDAYAALGVKVMITELDVDVLPLTREDRSSGR